MAVALNSAGGAADTVAAMRLALVGLGVTLALGLVLVLALPGTLQLTDFTAWVDLHLAWGLLGWGGLLIIGVGFQVVPMFHVAPTYPRPLRLALPPLVLAGLVAAALATLTGRSGLAHWGFGIAAIALVVFAIATLDRQHRRARRRLDANLLHWWSAMASLLLAAGLWLAGGHGEAVGVLILIGVGVGLPSGMLLKIAPFLSWFHLQHRQVTLGRFDLRLPNMHTLLPDVWGRAAPGPAPAGPGPAPGRRPGAPPRRPGRRRGPGELRRRPLRASGAHRPGLSAGRGSPERRGLVRGSPRGRGRHRLP